MPRYDANLLHLFTEVPFVERFALAADAGFAAIELAMPYEHNPEFLAETIARHGLEIAVMNTPSGDDVEARGLACDPRQQAAFDSSIQKALRYAEMLGRPLLHCLAGMTPADLDASEIQRTYVENLRRAAKLCAAKGVSIGIEAINPVDRPGYFVSSASRALELVEAIAEPNIGVILDVYHMAMTGEPILDLLDRAGSRLFHVQIADVPGKGEPGTGKIDFKSIFDALDSSGYDGWVGLEYRPMAGTVEGLGWRDKFEWSADVDARSQ